jgi:hypothetical protein
MDMNRILRTTGIALVAIAAVAALGTLLVRDQISRHQRDLFSPHPLRRLAALGYLGGRPASVDSILLLRDFIAWEPQPMLKKRAVQLLARLEEALEERVMASETV